MEVDEAAPPSEGVTTGKAREWHLPECWAEIFQVKKWDIAGKGQIEPPTYGIWTNWPQKYWSVFEWLR